MKTTIDLADDLARKAKKLATKRGITLKAVIEEAIRMSLERDQRAAAWRLPDKSVKGNGLQKEFEHKSWEEIREAAYEGKYH